MLDLRKIAAALGGVISNGQVLAPGPGHSRGDRSLSVKIVPDAPDGFIVKSFAGDNDLDCKDYVRQKLNLPAFQPNRGRQRRNPAEIEKLLGAAVDAASARPITNIAKTYDYTDETAKVLYQVCRLEPKSFRQRRPDGNGGWVWSLNGVRRVPYRLPNLIKYNFGTVFLCEGEKDADRLAEHDLVSTTAASGKWDEIDLTVFAGRDCMIMADNDPAGEKKASAIASLLHSIAATVRIVRLPGLPDKGDVSDWLDANRDNVERLVEFCFDAPLWAPATELPASTASAPATVTTASKASLNPSPPLPPLPFINVVGWQGEPVPVREWAVLNRIPMSNVTLFSGEGGVGKSVIALQLAVAHVLGQGWFGSMPEYGPVLAVCCEDDAAELHRRISLILALYKAPSTDLKAPSTDLKASFTDLKDLHLISFAGQDALMATPDRFGIMRPTPLFNQLFEAACDIHPKLIVLDNSADVFGGSENDRAQVRQFIGILHGLAIAAHAGVLLTSHPSLTGISSGTGLSGSTAWNASVRSRLWMRRATTDKGKDEDEEREPDPDLRVIEIMKANYARTGEIINIRWKDGVFVPVTALGTLEKIASDRDADELFLRLLARFTLQGRNASHSPTANNYAPTMFAKDPEGKGKRKELTTAMNRLFVARKIKSEKYGRQGSARLVRWTEDK
jgi:RecA-family ATPase